MRLSIFCQLLFFIQFFQLCFQYPQSRIAYDRFGSFSISVSADAVDFGFLFPAIPVENLNRYSGSLHKSLKLNKFEFLAGHTAFFWHWRFRDGNMLGLKL